MNAWDLGSLKQITHSGSLFAVAGVGAMAVVEAANGANVGASGVFEEENEGGIDGICGHEAESGDVRGVVPAGFNITGDDNPAVKSKFRSC